MTLCVFVCVCVCVCGSVRGVMDAIVLNENGDISSNPVRHCSYLTKYL